MIIKSIKDRNIFKIEDEVTKQIHYGTNQDWYRKRWQRMAGCGPSAVTNMIHYHNSARSSVPVYRGLTKSECLDLMNEIWNYVTPSLGGVSSTDMMCRGIEKYVKEKQLGLALNFIDIPRKKELRPELQQVLSFLVNALEQDTPIAFLNLEHGTVYELESWHWVTIISLEYETERNTAFVEVLDGGLVKRLDLARWLKTTKLGGGFVSFKL